MRPMAVVAGATAAIGLLPAATSVPRVGPALWPRLSGVVASDHVALSFDDGPDHSTPAFLDLLDEHAVRATFFLLGEHIVDHTDVVRRMHEAGHEIAVHGWDHRCLALRVPGGLRHDLVRTARTVEVLTGQAPRRYRPPYGVLTSEGLWAARRAGLEPVLWSAWGRDWSVRATPRRIVDTVARGRVRGGTVLLHDSDRTSAPGSWRHTLTATAELLTRWREQGLPVGTLASHQPA